MMTDVENLIHAIVQDGGTITATPNDRVRVAIPRGKAGPTLRWAVAAHKQEILQALRRQTDCELHRRFLEVALSINERYLPGTIAFIQENDLSLYEGVVELDKELNSVWRSVVEGRESMADFEKILEKWRLVYLHQIDVFKKSTGGP